MGQQSESHLKIPLGSHRAPGNGLSFLVVEVALRAVSERATRRSKLRISRSESGEGLVVFAVLRNRAECAAVVRSERTIGPLPAEKAKLPLNAAIAS